MTRGRFAVRRHVGMAVGLALVAALMAPVAGLHVGTALAVPGEELCPPSAGGFPLKSVTAWPSETDFSTVACAYDNTHERRNQTSLGAEVIWHDIDAVGAPMDQIDRRFCDRGEAGDQERLVYDAKGSTWDLSRIGERRIYTYYAWDRDDKQGAARKLADKLMRAVEGRATACPGAIAGDAPGDGGAALDDGAADGRTEIVLSGQRLEDLRRAGGIGAVISLEGDEGYGLVLRDANGDVVSQQDLLGSRGRVVEMGVSLVGEDGVELVSVTVEVLPAADSPDPGADPGEPGADPGEPGADPGEPGADPGDLGVRDDDQAGPIDEQGGTGSADDDRATDPADETDQVEPVTGTGVADRAELDDSLPPDAADDPIGRVVDRVIAELEDIAERGSGSVIVESGEIAAAAQAVGSPVASVRPRQGKIEIALVSNKLPRLFVYPEVDRATGEVSIITKVEPPGDFGFVEIPIEPSLVPGLGPVLERGLEALNAELRRRSVRPTSIVINESGVLVDFEATP